jgi:Protein of unknown function (DUF2786)
LTYAERCVPIRLALRADSLLCLEGLSIIMERIIDRVRKLLELAGNNPNEHEALAAMEMASRLMAQHNIELATVEAEKKRADEPTVEERFPALGNARKWGRTVWGAVARLNFCQYFYHAGAGDTDRNFLIGTKANITATKVMIDYLIATIERLSRETPTIPDTERRAFCLGAAMRVAQRLDELMEQRKKGEQKSTVTSTGNNLPALASLYQQHKQKNEQAYQHLHPGHRITSGTASKTRNWGAFDRGRAAGDTISLNQQVGNAGQRRLS